LKRSRKPAADPAALEHPRKPAADPTTLQPMHEALEHGEVHPIQPHAGPKGGYPPIERKTTSFDPKAMQRLLDGEYADIRNLVKQLITQPEFRYYEGTNVEVYRGKVLGWTRRIADAGVGRAFMARSVGGEENLSKFMAAFETLAFHDLSLIIKLGVHFGLFAGSIQRLGTEYHHRKYLPEAAAAKILGGFAMTEIGHGSNVQELETTAVYDRKSDSFIINSPTYSSGKAYIGNASDDGRFMIVFAQLDLDGYRHGVHAFVVPIRDEKGAPMPGVIIEDNGLKMGLNGVDNGKIWFNQVRISRAELLNRFADVTPDGKYQSEIQSQGPRFFTMIGTLVNGRISIAVSANTATKSALTIALRYAARRRQFGRQKGGQETLLLDYPSHQRRLIPLLANAYALDFALKHLIQVSETAPADDSRPIDTLAAGLKAYTTWNTTRTIQICREACGGEGYIASNRLAALKADTDVFMTFEGDNTVLMQLVAKNLLSGLQDKLREMRPAQLTGFFLDHKLSVLAKRNPAFAWNASEDHLLNADTQLALFRLREISLLMHSASEFRNLTGTRRFDAYSAFTQLQPELLELAHAHVERVMLEQFVASIKSLPDESLRSPLKRLCDLFALAHLEQGKGWYLENGVMSGSKSKAITRLVTRLCAEVRKDAIGLVDAFGIPDACLGAPIAL
jgi:acyl-CoA oxidase